LNPHRGGQARFSEVEAMVCEVPEWADQDPSILLPTVLKGHDVELQWSDYDSRSYDAIDRFGMLIPHNGFRGTITEYHPLSRAMGVEWNALCHIDILDLILNSVVNYAYNYREGISSPCDSSIALLTKLLQYYDDEEGYRVEFPDTSKGKNARKKPPRIFICDLESRNYISSYEFEEYARIFAHYDKDGSGGLDLKEMEEIFEELNIFADIYNFLTDKIIAEAASKAEVEEKRERIRRQKKEKIDELYKEIDEDQNGAIEFNEFLQFMIKVKTKRNDSTFGRQFQDLIHTEIQDTGIIQQISKRLKKCISPIFGYTDKGDLDYFMMTIHKYLQVLYGPSTSSSMSGFDDYMSYDKLETLLNFIIFLNECNHILELSTDLSKILINMFASSRFLSDMRNIQHNILSNNYARDVESFEVYTIQVKVIYELCRLIGSILIKMTDKAFVSFTAQGSDTSEVDFKVSSYRIIDFFLETFYSFTKFDFGINFLDSMYSCRHRIISLCIDILESVTRFQYNLSPTMKYLLENLFTMDSHGMRSFNWLLNTALNPILCLELENFVNEKEEWWNVYDHLDIFDFVLSGKKARRVISNDLLKELVLTSIKSSGFIIHLIDIASRQPLVKTNIDIFSIVVEVFFFRCNRFYLYI